MPVTEIATLRLVPPHTWDLPEIQSFFGDVGAQQAAWSGHPLHFFQDVSDEQTVYILTGWESVPAHFEWIKSEPNQRLLERAKGLIEVVGLQHARLEAKLEGAQFVVLEQWGRDGSEEGVDEAGGDTGVVEETPEQVCSVWGYGSEHEYAGKRRQGGKTVCVRRLTVHGSAPA